MKPKLVIFDLDGVLVDSKIFWYNMFNFMLKKFGEKKISIEEFENFVWGMPTEKVTLRYVKHVSVKEIKKAFFSCHKRFLKFTSLMPSANNVLDTLRAKGIKIALATNTHKEILDDELKMYGLEKKLDLILCESKKMRQKPYPDMLRYACEHFKISPDDAIFVGDTPIDIEAGKNAGIYTIGIGILGNRKINKLEELKGVIMDIFDNINPIDFRYYGRNESVFKKLTPYLSENASIKYLARIEVALVNVLAKRKLCTKEIAKEVSEACMKISAEEVYLEEDRIKHNVRALVNEIRKKVSKEAKPYVHFTTTSHDIICTAEALRFKEFSADVLVPSLLELEKTLIHIALREKSTLQIGRTHGQHAEPITFGHTVASYVSRLGNRISAIQNSSKSLKGKISGAVGAYNASSLFFEKPAEFEKEVLSELGLEPGTHSTQVVEPEYMADFIHSVVSAFSVLAQISDDFRNLQRSEIGEIGEEFGKAQVGSSTMPHKRNPINFENVKSMWKAYMPRMTTIYLDQISEHQRDLTNSASSRYNAEILAALLISAERLNKTLSKILVDKENLMKNFEMNKGMVAAEPLYILLAANGHPDAHEKVRTLTLESQQKKKSFYELAIKDPELKKYLNKFTKKQLSLLKNPESYIGISIQKTEDVCRYWKENLKI